MINFHRWSDNAHQFVFEGNSFYYSHSICVAFREKRSKDIYVKGQNTSIMDQYTAGLVHMLSHSGKIKYMKPSEFIAAVNGIYAKSLLAGVRRVGLDILFQNNNKGEENVTDFKSDAG